MKFDEAQKLTRKFNLQEDIFAKVVRILPADIDPELSGDNGWDIEVRAIFPGTSIFVDEASEIPEREW